MFQAIPFVDAEQGLFTQKHGEFMDSMKIIKITKNHGMFLVITTPHLRSLIAILQMMYVVALIQAHLQRRRQIDITSMLDSCKPNHREVESIGLL